MPISNKKYLQRIVKKYDLIPYDIVPRDVYKPKPTGLIEFNGGLIKLDYRGFWLCELKPSWFEDEQKVVPAVYIPTHRSKINYRVKKIVEYYNKCALLYKKKLLKDKIKTINHDF